MQLKTSCPHCKAFLSFHSKLLGRSANCPKCQTDFVVTESATVAVDPEATVLAVAPSVAIGSGPTGTFKPMSADVVPSIVQLGKYQIRGTLGRGGFGLVYQAYDPLLERLLALKVPTFGPEDIDQVKRFRDEAKAAAQLRHPNIVPVYESGQIDDRYYIASQFIDGKPLSSVVKAGPVDLYDAATWCAKLAEALAYAHKMKIVHRDVKPQNIMLDGREEPQLMDFGLAKRLDDAAGVTGDGTILGTPAYMAPEQARGDVKRIGAHTDQYSLGVTLYELLTGRRPFVGEPLTVLHLIVHEEPPPPSLVNAKIPRDLEAITQKAMSKEISSRYTNCEDLANDLWRWLVGEPILARPISTSERLARWARRNRSLAAAFAATAAALLLVALLGFTMAVQLSSAKQQVEGEQEKTKNALDDVTKERDRAENQTRLAKAQATIAEDRRQAEAEQRKLADERLEVSQANAYVARIRLAAAKWDAGDSVGMNAVLDALRPKPGEKDRRGWEWNYLWNQSHREFATIPVGRFPIISPDGLSVLSVESGSRVLRVLRTGEIRLRLPLPEFPGPGLACFSPDGRWIYTGDCKGEFICWDSTTGAERYSLNGPQYLGRSVYYPNIIVSKDGTQLVTSHRITDYAGEPLPKVCVWDAATGSLLRTIEIPESIHGMDLSPNGRFLMTGGGLWDIQSGSFIRRLRQPNRAAGLGCFAPDGKTIAAFSEGGISFWNSETGTHDERVFINDDYLWRAGNSIQAHRSNIGICYSADGTRLAGISGGMIKVWDVATGREQLTLKGSKPLYAVTFSPDGRWLFSIGDQELKIWDAISGTTDLRIEPWEPGNDPGYAINGNARTVFSADGKKLLAHGRPVASIWDLQSGTIDSRLFCSYRPEGPYLQMSAFSTDGHVVFGELYKNIPEEGVTIHNHNIVRRIYAWNCRSGETIFVVNGKKEGLVGALFTDARFAAPSADGRKIAVSDLAEKSVIQILDSSTGQELQRLNGHADTVCCAAWDRETTRLVTGSDSGLDPGSLDAEVIIWSLKEGRPLYRLRMPGPFTSIASVAFNPAGDRIVVTAIDRNTYSDSVQIWNAKTGELASSLPGHFSHATFSPDGRRIITSSYQRQAVQCHVTVVDIDTLEELLTLKPPQSSIPRFTASATMSSDGFQMACRYSSFNSSNLSVEEVFVLDGSPESHRTAHAQKRAARSTVAWFRVKTKSQDELVAAIKNDPTINEETRALAVEFALRPPAKIVELQLDVPPDILCLRKAFAAHRANDPQQLSATLEEAKRDFPEDELMHRKIAHLLKLLNPTPLVKLAELPTSVRSVPLADVHLEAESVGWDQSMRNRSGLAAHNNVLLEVKGTFFESGLWAHAPARHVVRLDGGWKEFTTRFGIRDESIYGSVVFVVRGDGKELFRSETMTPGKIGELKVSVADCTELELVVEELGNTNSDWSLWLNPQLSR